MNLVSLAARNVSRSRHRTVVTVLAMAFACTMMILFAALMKGFIIGSERNVVSMNTGDIQVHQPGYRDNPDIYRLMTHASTLTDAFRQAGFASSERIFAYGLMASDNSSSGVQLHGVQLETEPTVTLLYQHIMAGEWLAEADPYGIVIGKKLAKLLDVTVGDELIFVGQTADGYMANDRFVVKGVLKSVSVTIDNAGVFMSDTALRNLIALPAGAHELVVMRTDHDQPLEQAAAEIQNLAGDELEVMHWQQLMPIIYRFLQTAEIQTLIMMVFTYIAVGSVVLNAMLMNVFERIHEFGIMKAVGVKPWQLVGLIYLEMLFQTLLAIVLAIIAGGALAFYFERHGIDMSSLAEGISLAGLAFDPIWYAALTPDVIILPVLFLFVIATVSVVYPALKVAIMSPLDAIHHQ